MSLSEPHTSVTALQDACVCLSVCVWHRFAFLWLIYSRNKFFRVGPNILEKFVPGGTNFSGVQIKRDKHVCNFEMYVFLQMSVGSMSLGRPSSYVAMNLWKTIQEWSFAC